MCSPVVTGLKSKLTSPSPCNSICPSARPLGDYREREGGGSESERRRAKIEWRGGGGGGGRQWVMDGKRETKRMEREM